MVNNNLKNTDLDIYNLIEAEKQRQIDHLEMIASENFVSPAIMEAVGSILTNKYAEGYPNKRYYGGCEHVDKIEQLAIERAKQLFGAEHANVQPHSGSQANQAVYQALLQPGDKILGMDLSHGGHLTHGAKVSSSGQLYDSYSYGVDENGYLNFEEELRIAKKVRPKLIIAGASAYSRPIDFAGFKYIADQVGALLMVDMAHIAGLVATGLHSNPVEYADVVTSTTHKTLRGPRGGLILCKEKYAKAIDKAIFPGIQGGPLEHVIAGKAVCFKEAMSKDFADYQKQVVKNAKALAESLTGFGFNVVSGGTDNHLMLLDLRNYNITGKEMEQRLGSVGITVNKNTVPNETNSPFITSGIRIGTPAITTRGMKEQDMRNIARLMYLIATTYEESKDYVSVIVQKLCEQYPLYE